MNYVIDIIAPITQLIFNLAPNTDPFPIQMQIAKVTAIYKGGNEDNLTNDRPVSVLPVFSKCLEKVIYVRLTNFFEKHYILFPSQFGFQKYRSHELALLTQKKASY